MGLTTALKKEVNELHKKGPVFDWVQTTDGDGEYLTLVKNDFIKIVQYRPDQEYKAVRRDGGIHIN